MLVFSDNDVIAKLACCDLLDEALTALGVTKADVRVLPSAAHYFRRSAKLRSRIGNAVADRAARFAESVTVIQSAPDPSEYAALLAVDGIDAGEAVLFAATKAARDWQLLTGDKNGLRALASSSSCSDVCRRLTSRVMCLEQIVVRLIDHHGFPSIKRKIVPVAQCDVVLQVAFYDDSVTEAKVREALDRYILPLRSQTGSLLAS